jgi:UDP-N-acetylmuramate dehydrogenase
MSRSLDLPELAQERGLGAALSLNEPLSKHTSYGIGGPADYLATVNCIEQLCAWVALARELEQPFMVWGRGTNLLVADRGYRGLVIVNRCVGQSLDRTTRRAYAEAGVVLARLARQTSKSGSGGLEWAIGIPGTMGGAIVNNAGAYEGEIAGVVLEVSVLDCEGQIRELLPEELDLGYRTSSFKAATRRNEIILSAELQLVPEETEVLKGRIQRFTALRQAVQPRERSAGSVFKNPSGGSAGQLIEEAGLRGTRIGDAEISHQHANYIVNTGRAKALEVLKLINLVKERVHHLFGVELELEIELIGDWREADAN